MQATRAHRALLTMAVAAVIGAGCCVTVPPERNRAVEQFLRETQWANAREPAPTLAPSQITIYAPSTTSSVPVILAARQLAAQEDTDLTIFDNHSQANTLFLRGDVDILVTGLSVGAGFLRNGAPVQVINCYVSGLTYLVTHGRQVNSFAELGGGPLYLPFEGSPIEETTRFFVEQEGLIWKQDIVPVYAPADSSLALLAQGKAAAVALPEPYVSLAEQQERVYVSIGYRERWDALTGSGDGYPQVCAFVKKEWADAHRQTIARFNDELAEAIRTVRRDPAAAADQTEEMLGFTQETLRSALRRTDFELRDSDEMEWEIRRYYRIVGKPLDASYDPLFYR
jgi:ABC-type nitrate/sulfonate/bicarbonate transport system substrate-binding protein